MESEVPVGRQVTPPQRDSDLRSESCRPALRSHAEMGYNFEWGCSLKDAYENVALAMYNYMTPLSHVTIDDTLSREFTAEGHDLQSLLFDFMEELLVDFETEHFICKEVVIDNLDRENWKIVAHGRGELFQKGRHPSGTEIKAITYSNMQIHETDGDAEVFVIVDI